MGTRAAPKGAAPPVTDRGRTEGDLEHEIARHRRGRVPRGLRRSHALLAATTLFLEHGYRGTSMEELATRCGISKPVLYDLVGSKEQLFTDVMTAAAAELADRITEAVEAETDPARRLYAGALAFFRFAAERHPAWRTLLAPGLAPGGSQIERLRSHQVDQLTHLLTQVGLTDVPLDPDRARLAARAITGANEAIAVWWQRAADSDGQRRPSAQTLAEFVTTLFAPGLAGLTSHPTADTEES